jgi:hypothetical protein
MMSFTEAKPVGHHSESSVRPVASNSNYDGNVLAMNQLAQFKQKINARFDALEGRIDALPGRLTTMFVVMAGTMFVLRYPVANSSVT